MARSANPLHNVVITGPPIAEDAMELLSEKCTVEHTKPYLKSSELARKLQDNRTDGLLVRMGQINEEVVLASSNLKVIAKHGTGVDNIDISVASKRRIPVLITPFANYESVAEHVLGLMFALAKDIPRLDSRIRQGYWDKPNYRGVELYEKALGLIGFGRIGRRVAQLVAPLKMKVLVYDPYLPAVESASDIIRVREMRDVLESADIVSLHCPLIQETRHLIGKDEFKIMKKTAWLINTARGEVVDEEALIDALRGGEITAAGLDTFEKEPPEDIQALCDAGKTVLTHHVAGITEESFQRLGMEAAKNILTILEGRTPDRTCLVNPEVFEDL